MGTDTLQQETHRSQPSGHRETVRNGTGEPKNLNWGDRHRSGNQRLRPNLPFPPPSGKLFNVWSDCPACFRGELRSHFPLLYGGDRPPVVLVLPVAQTLIHLVASPPTQFVSERAARLRYRTFLNAFADVGNVLRHSRFVPV